MKQPLWKTGIAVAVSILAYYLLGRFCSFTVIFRIAVMPQYAVLGAVAVAFGPLAGLVVALAGQLLVVWGSFTLWWGWILAAGFVGLFTGFFFKGYAVDGGLFDGACLRRYIKFSALLHAVAWVVIAPVIDIVFLSEPLWLTFRQGAFTALSNILVAVIGGGILLKLYTSITGRRNTYAGY